MKLTATIPNLTLPQTLDVLRALRGVGLEADAFTQDEVDACWADAESDARDDLLFGSGYRVTTFEVGPGRHEVEIPNEGTAIVSFGKDARFTIRS